MTREQVFHHRRDEGPHPLDGIAAVIAASAGEGFIRHMEKRNVAAVLTGETDPRKAVAAWCANAVPPPKRRRIASLLCKARDLFSEHH